MSTPVKLSAPQLQQLIRDEIVNSTELGLQLGLEYPMLKQLMSQYGQRRKVDECFSDMCDSFLHKKEGRTWDVVYKALESQGKKRLMVQLKEKYPPNTRVELSLIDFKNELDVMESPWYLFGCALGIETKVLDRIEYRDDLGRYMTAMLERWLDTGEATWEKLQKALNKIGNERLAQGLEGHKTGQQDDLRGAMAGTEEVMESQAETSEVPLTHQMVVTDAPDESDEDEHIDTT